EEWPTKTLSRLEGAGFAETPENARAIAALENKTIPVQFKGNRLSDVLDYVRANTGTSFDVSWDSLANLVITHDTPLNLMLKDTPAKIELDRALKQVSRDHSVKADFTVSDGIVTVASSEDIQRQTSKALYNITDLLLVIPDYDKVPPLDLS